MHFQLNQNQIKHCIMHFIRPSIQSRMARGRLAPWDLPVHLHSQGVQSEFDGMGRRNHFGSQVHPPGMDRHLYDRVVRIRILLEVSLWVQRTTLCRARNGGNPRLYHQDPRHSALRRDVRNATNYRNKNRTNEREKKERKKLTT